MESKVWDLRGAGLAESSGDFGDDIFAVVQCEVALIVVVDSEMTRDEISDSDRGFAKGPYRKLRAQRVLFVCMDQPERDLAKSNSGRGKTSRCGDRVRALSKAANLATVLVGVSSACNPESAMAARKQSFVNLSYVTSTRASQPTRQ